MTAHKKGSEQESSRYRKLSTLLGMHQGFGPAATDSLCHTALQTPTALNPMAAANKQDGALTWHQYFPRTSSLPSTGRPLASPGAPSRPMQPTMTATGFSATAFHPSILPSAMITNTAGLISASTPTLQQPVFGVLQLYCFAVPFYWHVAMVALVT